MKIRMIAVVLILAVAAWLPATAQQSATPPAQAESAKPAAKSACACCEHAKDQGKEATGDHASMACCPGKEGEAAKSASCCDGKEMACCKKEGKDNQTAMNCCGSKVGKMCASKNMKECCGRDAMAGKGKDGKNCCAGPGHACSHGATQS